MSGGMNPNAVLPTQASGGKGGGTTATPTGPMPYQGAGPTAASPNNVYQQSANAYQGALSNTDPGSFGARTAANMNPYTQQVTNRSMADLERQRLMSMNNMGAAATQANAFGGSRHGVAEAETNRNFADIGANMYANQNMNNFNNAQNVSMQQGNNLANLSQQGFGYGQAIGNQQMQQGLLQQGLSQQLIDAAKQQWQGYTNAPAQSLSYPLAAIGGVPQPQSSTSTKKPGLFDYLTLGASIL